MLNPSRIHPKHIVPLNNALMKHRSVNDTGTVTALYEAAKQLFFTPPSPQDQHADAQKVLRSRIMSGPIVIASCMDAETGLFVQLVGEGQASMDQLLLTFGQKWITEIRDPVSNSYVTKAW